MRIVILAKHPTPGRVKTRLAARIGPETAARIHRAFVQDLRARLDAAGAEAWWAYWPADASFGEILPGARAFPQEGGDLGERMWHAMERVRAGRDGPVAVVGADVPHLPLAALTSGRTAFASGADVVLGPALDGGYWLLATRVPQPALFAPLGWGTDGVLAATRARIRAGGLTLREVTPLRDVDDLDDLLALRRTLRLRPGWLPRTEIELATLEG